MKDDDRATMAKRTDDAANRGDKEGPGTLEEPVDNGQDERRSRGERRYSHSTGARNPERRTSARRASDKGTSDKGNAAKE